MKIKLTIIIFIASFIIPFQASACAVCLGDFTENEILAYSFSVLFMIAVLFIMIYFLIKKVSKNYDIN